MNKKLLLVGLGMLLVASSFFIGIKYKQVFEKNKIIEVVKEVEVQKECPAVKECPVFAENANKQLSSLDFFMSAPKKYTITESREFLKEKGINGIINFWNVYEVRDVIDDKDHLKYQIYRLGEGDESMKFSKGRIFLRVFDLRYLPTYYISMFDTEIDALELEPLGKTFIRNGKLIMTCSSKEAGQKDLCEYELDFSKDTHNLKVTRKM